MRIDSSSDWQCDDLDYKRASKKGSFAHRVTDSLRSLLQCLTLHEERLRHLFAIATDRGQHFAKWRRNARPSNSVIGIDSSTLSACRTTAIT